jgi:hypothetical protein
MGRKGVMVTVVQRNGHFQVVQFVGRGNLFTIESAILVCPEIKLAEPPFVTGHEGMGPGRKHVY